MSSFPAIHSILAHKQGVRSKICTQNYAIPQNMRGENTVKQVAFFVHPHFSTCFCFTFHPSLPKSAMSVMRITAYRCLYVLRAQWGPIVTDKRKDR